MSSQVQIIESTINLLIATLLGANQNDQPPGATCLLLCFHRQLNGTNNAWGRCYSVAAY